MTKPKTVAQEVWDTMDDVQKMAVIRHEFIHKILFKRIGSLPFGSILIVPRDK